MNEGKKIRLLVNYRYHNKGHIGLIDQKLGEDTARVDLNWNDDSRNPHWIFIRKAYQDELWELV